ncbi:MAG: hypothetical protein A3D92_22960, partial [Bacteroidetes bacterium RIFCSPHIGHO2_02_FULL_44_7]
MKALLVSLLCILHVSASSQTAELKGTVLLASNSEPVVFAHVLLIKNGAIISGCTTDFDGNYSLKNFPAGTFTLQASGFDIDTISQSITLAEGVITEFNLTANQYKLILEEVTIRAERQEVSHSVQTISFSRQDVSRIPSVGSGSIGRRAKSQESTSEHYGHLEDNTYKAVTDHPLSTFSIDVDRAAYAIVRRKINEGTLPPADAVRIEEMINYFNYDYPAPTDEVPFSLNAEYTVCPWNTQHGLVHIAIKGEEVDLEQSPANNLVFLIDVSGSMGSPDKLPLLKQGLYLLIDQLRDEDHVAIVVYAGAAGLVLPSTSGNQKSQIKSVIEQLDAGGSTAGGEGINLAYKTAQDFFIEGGNNRIVLATDGDFNVGISDDGELIKLIEERREHGIFLSVLGFGMGNLQDYKMEQIADKGNGNYNYIDNPLEAKKVLVTEMGGTLLTIAKDVKIQAEFNPQHVKGYRLIGYENRLLNDEDFDNDAKDAGEMGAGHTVTVLYEIIPAGSDEAIPSKDSLRYQTAAKPIHGFDNELMRIKMRYKEPGGVRSKLVEKSIPTTAVHFVESSKDCQFAASVTAFGMLLRNSSFK